MNENEPELESNATSLKHRIGKTMILGGFIWTFFSLTPIIEMFYVLILRGAGFQVAIQDYAIESLFFFIGFVTILAGLIIYGTSLFSNEGLWTLQTGPYVR